MPEHLRTFALGELLTRRYPRAAYRQPAYIAGTVKVEGEPVRRRVRCIERQTGRFIAETWSAADGSYRFDDLYPGRAYLVIAMDYALEYNAVVADNVAPVLADPPTQEEPEQELLLPPGDLQASYDKDTTTLTLTWRNVNHTQEAVEVYRDTAPLDPDDLPAPLATLGAFAATHDDDAVVELETYYYRLAVTRGSERIVSDELVAEELGSNPFEGLDVGDPVEGGYFAGVMLDESDVEYGLVVSPKAEGDPGGTMVWQNAMDFAAGLSIGGRADWALPTLDEMRILYRAFKPTTQGNNTSYGATDRVDPPLDNYTSGDPSQTGLADFQGSGPEAFVANFYWSATESSSSGAWRVFFFNGYEYSYPKTTSNYVRAVRRVYF